jgi:hypothetical protein
VAERKRRPTRVFARAHALTNPFEMTDLSKTGHVEVPGGEAGSGTPLNRGLGASQIVFMVVAAAAPLGLVAGGVPLAFAVSGSPGMPLYFALSTVLLLIFAVGFTLMAGRLRNAGAFYAYIQAGLGRTPGLFAATLALFSSTLLLVGVNAYVGVATSNVIERYADTGSPWWAWALVLLGVIAVLGYRDIELSAKVLGAVLVLESLLLLVVDFGIVGHGGAHGLTAEPLSPSIVGTGSVGLGVMFAVFGFIGFEAMARVPQRGEGPRHHGPAGDVRRDPGDRGSSTRSPCGRSWWVPASTRWSEPRRPTPGAWSSR